MKHHRTEDAAKAVADQEKLLYSGKTDADGKIPLKNWHTVGEIRIVEKEVPEGYTTDTMETITDLSEGEVTIVNKKIEEVTTKPEEKKDTPVVEEITKQKVKETTEQKAVETTRKSEEKTEVKSAKGKGVNTGDDTNMMVWLLLMVGSSAGIIAAIRKYYR